MSNKQDHKPTKKKKIINIREVLIGIVLVIYIATAVFTAVKDAVPITGTTSYLEIMDMIDNGTIKSIQITKDSNKMIVYTTDGQVLDAINPKSDTFIEDLMKKGVDIQVQKTSVTDSVTAVLATLPLMLIMAMFVVFLSSTMMGGKTKQFTLLKLKDNKTTFDDIQGLSETKKDVEFVVDQMQNWKTLDMLGARPCKGILLYGPPGTGKTLLARAIANEAKVNFISCSGSDFNEVFVGVGAARVRQLWELALTNAPCIIFIDEIDCLGRRRRGGDGATNELNQTLNCLLQKMDGINSNNGIMVIGATNRKEDLDAALLRPGRFDRQYLVGPPTTKKDRDEIVKIYLDTKQVDAEVTLDKASKLLTGMTGAEIENVLNEAVYVSIRDKRNGIIRLSDIDEATMQTITAGVKKEHSSKRDEQIVAYHEAGHTLVSLLNKIKVSKVSIIPYSSGMGGVTMRDTDDDNDNKLKLKSDFIKDIEILLAGKVAEELIFGEHTQGCSNDIEKATQLVYAMVTEYGFLDDNLMNERVLIENGLKESLEASVITDCNKLLTAINKSVTTKIKENIEVLKAISKELLEHKTLVSPTLEDFTGLVI